MRHIMGPTTTLTLLSLALLTSSAHAQNNSKRGFAYVGNSHTPDNSLLQADKSPLTWYYNWSPYPNRDQIAPENLEFVPLIHGIDGAEDSQTARALNNLPDSSNHILTFNEPDGEKDTGGSSISPEDAARAYIDHILPYREGKNGDRKWYISHPSTTGSPTGLGWLREFNSSCYEIDSENGCPTDFIAAHWYGAFDGLTSWLGTLDDFYNGNRSDKEPKLRVWLTEMALPQADERATVAMMNRSLGYLDELEYVERYAWFGAFRTDDANEWTGDGVALFDDDGGLTELGALYLGGEGNGFAEGQKGEGGAAGLCVHAGVLLCFFMIAVILPDYW
jgi:hypothetical protein